jgi:small-conductance mechanosensitive channel
MELRFWIDDPENGVGNVKSQVLLKLWDRFKTGGIAIALPQQDVNLVGPVEMKIADGSRRISAKSSVDG